MDFSKQELQEAVDNALSMADVLRHLHIPENGNNRRKLKLLVDTFNIDISHINGAKATSIKNTRWETSIVNCPVCGDEFETKIGHPKEKKTCGYSCSNTYFRTGDNNGNWSYDSYRSTCFLYHGKQCIVCDEKKIVAVHHYDEDHTNNSPENLIPLCPTHHQYWHSNYIDDVRFIIDEYRNNFITNQKEKII